MKSLLLALSFALTACAGLQSTYKPNDFSGGFGDEKLKDGIYLVYFDANGFTDKEISKKYFLRRASQVTLMNGQSCFKIIDQKNTLGANFMSQKPEAMNTKYYYSNNYEVMDTEKNKADENSVAALIQLSNTPSAGCFDAKTTLETSSVE